MNTLCRLRPLAPSTWIRNVVPVVLAPSADCGFTRGEHWRQHAAGRCSHLSGCPAHLFHQPNGAAFQGAARCVTTRHPHPTNRFPLYAYDRPEACDIG